MESKGLFLPEQITKSKDLILCSWSEYCKNNRKPLSVFSGLQTCSVPKSSGFSQSQRALCSCQYVRHNAAEKVIPQEYKTWSTVISSGAFPSRTGILSSLHSAAAAVFWEPSSQPNPPSPPLKKKLVFSSGTSPLLSLLSDLVVPPESEALTLKNQYALMISMPEDSGEGAVGFFVWIFSFWKPDRCISRFSERLK